MKQKIAYFIFCKLMGWKIEGCFPVEIKKSVIIVVPHTSWKDFFIGVLFRAIINVDIKWVGKKELFIFPFNYYFKWMGGSPLNRQKNEKKVDVIASMFQNQSEFRLAISPEGTRKKVEKWKSGFYYIAIQAEVPIIPVGIDNVKKVITTYPVFIPTGDYEKDYLILKKYFIDLIS